MAKQVQRRRGTTSQHSSFTGAVGETTVDTDKSVVVVHDGSTAGGFPLMKDDMSNYDGTTITSIARFGNTIFQRFTNDGSSVRIVLDNTAGSGSTDETAELQFQHNSEFGGKIVSGRLNDYSSNANEDSFLSFYVADSGADLLRMSLGRGGASASKGILMLGSSAGVAAGNANMTHGMTINQGTADNEILSLKSSDVAHAYTVASETDTFGYFKKVASTTGGLQIGAVAEQDDTALLFQIAYQTGSESTAKSTTGTGIIYNNISPHDGSGNLVNVGSDANLWMLKTRRGGTNPTVFIIDEDGDFHHDGTGSAYDTIDDLLPIRAAQIVLSSDPKDILRSEFDHAIYDNLAVAEEWGLIGKTTPEERAQGVRGLVNGAQMQRFFMGAHVQAYQRIMLMVKVLERHIPGITAEIQAELESVDMPRLPFSEQGNN